MQEGFIFKTTGRLFTRLIILIIFFGTASVLTSCLEDDPVITDNNGGENNNNTGGENNNGEYIILEQSPDLPATLFNYENISLPPYFNQPPVSDQDNTPGNNQITNEGATLGRVLFYDKNLSFNNMVSCASCHKQERAFADNAPFSLGFNGGLTGRNSMGLTNAKYYPNGHFFWDERAATLEEQTLMPIQNEIEMGMDLISLAEKLSLIPYYEDLFTDAFGTSEITSSRISLALAQFVRSMVSYQSKFDQGLQAIGSNPNFPNINFPNFTTSENQGKALFFSPQTNCATCHGTTNFVPTTARNNGLDLVYADNGIGEISGNPADNGLFKINSLRNIELTAPYMHDGRFNTLEQVIEHYNSGVQAHPNLSPQLQAGPGPGGPPPAPGSVVPRVLNLTAQEKTALVNFLKTLTDPVFVSDVRFSDPF